MDTSPMQKAMNELVEHITRQVLINLDVENINYRVKQIEAALENYVTDTCMRAEIRRYMHNNDFVTSGCMENYIQSCGYLEESDVLSILNDRIRIVVD
jgi:hypothetical protein